MKVRLRCKKCHYEFETELRLSPLGSLQPGDKNPASGIKIDKDSLDKILEKASGASREELEKIGLRIDPAEWEDALERLAFRKFLMENIKVSKEPKKTKGEKYVVATAPWQMGDSFRDVDLPSSEVKSMGVEDMRMIPGVTLQKKVYGITKGRDVELLKGIKFIVILDGSGSMIPGDKLSVGKIGKALLIGKEIYDFTRKLGFEYYLAIYSDQAVRIEDNRVKKFWEDAEERASYRVWNGGTRLAAGLAQFTDEEYKDSNVIIISDMDIADVKDSKERLIEIARLTNTFKIVLIEHEEVSLEVRAKHVKELFPEDVNLSIFTIKVPRE